MKIFIDTNKFLDFYRDNSEKPVILNELLKHKEYLIFTKQSRIEFLRNRNQLLRNVIKAIDDIKYQSPGKFPLIRDFEAFKKLGEYVKKINLVKEEIIEKLNKFLEDQTTDHVLKGFLDLQNDLNTLDYTQDNISNAELRKKLGNPPTSNDKYSIGDELNWEVLLGLDDNLIVVTRDKTFLENKILLATEYKDRTQKELYIEDSIAAALKLIKITPTKEFIQEEQSLLSYPDSPIERALTGNTTNIVANAISSGLITTQEFSRFMLDYLKMNPIFVSPRKSDDSKKE
jgi:hypothetical protein